LRALKVDRERKRERGEERGKRGGEKRRETERKMEKHSEIGREGGRKGEGEMKIERKGGCECSAPDSSAYSLRPMVAAVNCDPSLLAAISRKASSDSPYCSAV
jgi:hypothetical protein